MTDDIHPMEKAELEGQQQISESQASPQQSSQVETVADRVRLADILDLAIDTEASDIHFGAHSRIGLRIDGKIAFVENIPELNNEQAKKVIFQLIPDEEQQETLMRTLEMDTSFEHADGTSFRVNIFFKRRNISAVLRRIARTAFSLDELGIPDKVKDLLETKQGMILVTGPTGSGKSTSMQSMVEHINLSRVEHILTIEDPIEFIFESKKSIISQREVGFDTLSYSNSLRAALREDPDIVMVGEMRDAETIMAAMNLAETGHLVISTLHTSSASQTISRLVNAFPPSQHEQIQSRMADTLIGVLSQRLVPRADTKGRIAIFELLVVNAAIRNIIRSGDTGQILNAIQAGRDEGMIKMETYAQELEGRGYINRADYEHFFRHE
jgi:twitching motility protein PilT